MVYVVSADTCETYGASIYIFAVCDTEEKAREMQKRVNVFSTITPVELNNFKPIYLGGYMNWEAAKKTTLNAAYISEENEHENSN